MQNMRGVMPALQRARPAPLKGEGIRYLAVEQPEQRRHTRVVKDVPAEAIARDIVEWIR
jgi:electron transfer flavoprotein beta subunit